MDVSFPCKFSDKGCNEVGTRSPMQNHIRYCIFTMIKCNYLAKILPCNEMIPYGEMVDHLKNKHKAFECRTEASGEIKDIVYSIPNASNAYSRPIIAKIDDSTFVLNHVTRDNSLICWVTILGTEENAQKYEVKITAAPNDASAKTRGKVYSIAMSTEDILKDPSGTLYIGKNMADKMAVMRDGTPRIHTDYHIIRK